MVGLDAAMQPLWSDANWSTARQGSMPKCSKKKSFCLPVSQ
jgi:hypothetical protein